MRSFEPADSPRHRPLNRVRASVWVTVLVSSLAAWGSLASSEPLRVAQGTDVVGAWRPEQRLYIKGNLGVAPAQLNALEQWLDTHATNWVVVLTESAQGERYTDASGESFDGIEAVNHALGKGLMNTTAFGECVDPRTGERNACFFALFLKDRRFSYYGSEAQDRRGLGEDHWVGELDAAAIRAMRDGGRVVDAVKDTVTLVEGRLTSRIQDERTRAARDAAEQAAARERAASEAQAGVTRARSVLAQLGTRLDTFRKQNPEATGDLARPDLAGWQAKVELAQRAAEAGRFPDATRDAAAVQKEAEALLAALDQHATAARQFEELAGRYQSQAQGPHAAAAQSSLAEAASHLQSAREAHGRGASAYEAGLAAAAAALKSAGDAALHAARMAQARRVLVLLAASTTVSVLLLVALFLNRRRAKPMREARALYDLWREGMAEKTRGLFALLDQRASVVGTSTLDAEARYSGATLELSRRAIKDVDELFIMSASVDRILGEARTLLEPRSFGGRLGNRLRQAPFQRVLRLLRDEPIRFRPEERVELIVRGPRTERDALLGDVHSYQPFALTFNELIAAFNERADRALAALDQIVDAARQCAEAIDLSRKACDQAHADAGVLAQAGTGDGLFLLPRLKALLVPKALEELAAALRLSATDPVAALAGPAAHARRLSSDAVALGTAARMAREQVLPTLRENQSALAKDQVEIGWIDAALNALSDEADAAAAQALEGPAAKLVEELEAQAGSLAGRVATAATLNTRRRSEVEPAIDSAQEQVTAARARLSAALHLETGRALGERDLNPDDRLAKARQELAAAVLALNRGDVDGAAHALEGSLRATAEAGEIVEGSLQAVDRREGETTALREETGRLEGLLPRHREVLQEIQRRFAPPSWLLGAGDPEHPQANGTIADNIVEAEQSLASARSRLQKAETIFAVGRVLEAAGFWAGVRGDNELAAARLAEIEEKHARLLQVEESNRARLAELRQRLESDRKLAAAPSTTHPTLALLARAEETLTRVAEEVTIVPADPFATATGLDDLRGLLVEAEDRARCDLDTFEEARRSVHAAGSQLRQARSQAGGADRAALPASVTIQEAIAELGQLEGAFRALQSRLEVAHEDWSALDRDADQVAARGANIAATIAGEVARGQAAASALSAAATAVRMAGSWTGGFGVLIMGSPGSQALQSARQALELGAYEQARAQAETARRIAENAMAQAEAEVMQRRAAEAAARERERAARRAAEQARQAQRSVSGGGLGGILGSGSRGFGGSSWGSSGSGARTSGFRGGSGARTSGW